MSTSPDLDSKSWCRKVLQKTGWQILCNRFLQDRLEPVKLRPRSRIRRVKDGGGGVCGRARSCWRVRSCCTTVYSYSCSSSSRRVLCMCCLSGVCRRGQVLEFPGPRCPTAAYQGHLCLLSTAHSTVSVQLAPPPRNGGKKRFTSTSHKETISKFRSRVSLFVYRIQLGNVSKLDRDQQILCNELMMNKVISSNEYIY